MTNNNKSRVYLKSTAYDQTGQNYFQRLAAYDAMSSHLRRTLLATCAVDARNQAYVRKTRRSGKPCDCESPVLTADIADTITNTLKRDPICRSADCLRMCCDTRYFYRRDASKESGRSCEYVMSSSPPALRPIDLSRPAIESFTTDEKIVLPVRAKGSFESVNDRGAENSTFSESTSELRSREIDNPSLLLDASSSSESAIRIKNDRIKYANFVYEITREIIVHCFYTDEELRRVFEERIEANRKILDMNRMLYEIDRLKRAISVSDNLEDRDLDLVCTLRAAKTSGIPPSTPASVSTENANDVPTSDR